MITESETSRPRLDSGFSCARLFVAIVVAGGGDDDYYPANHQSSAQRREDSTLRRDSSGKDRFGPV